MIYEQNSIEHLVYVFLWLFVVLTLINLFSFISVVHALFTDLVSNTLVTTNITCFCNMVITHNVCLLAMSSGINELHLTKFTELALPFFLKLYVLAPPLSFKNLEKIFVGSDNFSIFWLASKNHFELRRNWVEGFHDKVLCLRQILFRDAKFYKCLTLERVQTSVLRN